MEPDTEIHRSSPAFPRDGSPPGVEARSRSLRDDVLVTLEYSGEVRAAILSLKYRGDTGQIGWMARHLARLVADRVASERRLVGSASLVITWCPTTSRRRRRRGFDVGELLARDVARSLGCRRTRLLRRIDRAPQTGATRLVRIDGPRLVARPPRVGASVTVVVVDDVVTTGSSLGAARRALEAVGVPSGSILCAAVAATPLGCCR